MSNSKFVVVCHYGYNVVHVCTVFCISISKNGEEADNGNGENVGDMDNNVRESKDGRCKSAKA